MKNNILKIFFLFAIFFIAPSFVSAAEKLLQSSDLTYLGSFKLPTSASNDMEFSYGANTMTFNPTNNSLFVSGSRTSREVPKVAEVSIPITLGTGAYASLPVATYLQGFMDITEGNAKNIGDGGATCYPGGSGSEYVYGSILSYGTKLVGTILNLYDATHCQVLTHFTSGKTLATSGDFVGMKQMSEIDSGNAGGAVKSMSIIPTEYQTALGGKALVGGTGMSILGRTSWGPSAFVFDPDQIGVTDPVPSTKLLYYNEGFLIPGTAAQSTNPIWNRTTYIQGMSFVQGTKSILYFGTHGTGTYCYGTVPPCFDPLSDGGSGEHSTTWDYQFWAYDVDDFIAVKNGIKQSYEPVPYAYWTIHLPYGDVNWNGAIGGPSGTAYDPDAQRLYIAQSNANDDGYPAIHVFQLNVSAALGDTIAPAAPTGLSVQ